MTNLCVVLENINTGETLDLEFNVLENSTAKKWVNQLRLDLKTHDHDGGHFRHFNVSMNWSEAVEALDKIIDIVNNEDNNANLPNIYKDTLDQHTCNVLHDYFVKTSNSEWIKGYPSETFTGAIEDLNRLIHYCEGLIKNEGMTKSHGKPRIVCSLKNAPVLPLEDSDYDNFTTKKGNIGKIVLACPMIGKTYIGAFRSNDTVCDDNEVMPQNVYSSSFQICFTNRPSIVRMDEFKQWMIDRGFDINDKKSAIGTLLVANPLSPINDDMIDRIGNHDHIKEIRIYD